MKLDDVLVKGKKNVIQVAPAVRVTLGELYGLPAGTPATGKVVGCLKALGFDFVFDTSFGADVVVAEESAELAKRLKDGGPFPIFNSCCPGSVLFLEHAYPELVPSIVTVKSPMEVTGSLIKSYFAEKKKIAPSKINSVALMPCMIKKTEARKPEFDFEGIRPVDCVITTVELAALLEEAGVDFKKVKECAFDDLLGVASGAGQIFGSSGGVSEASIRNYAFLKGLPLEKLDSKPLRGSEGLREETFDLGGERVSVLVINCLKNAPAALSDKKRLAKYNFVEMMACLGGCVGGAGQPPSTLETLEARRKGLYGIDAGARVKVAAQNPQIKALYDSYLGEPRSEKAMRILHTQHDKVCQHCA
ncbi:MAG: [Fe-Fe] hydrogenase large subunit C-terminal domain-containing protein [Candidatus Micrarchaeia archaeon]